MPLLNMSRRSVANGAGLLFLDKRKAHVYRKVSAWCTYSFASVCCYLSMLNDPLSTQPSSVVPRITLIGPQ
jgi:hypothetical protein